MLLLKGCILPFGDAQGGPTFYSVKVEIDFTHDPFLGELELVGKTF